MEVPKDYVIEMMRQALDGRLAALSEKVSDLRTDLKEDIAGIRGDIRTFQEQCRIDMKNQGDRIEELEHFKYKVYAVSGAIAAVSGFVFSYIEKVRG